MIRPKQRIPSSQKTKSWIEDSARYFSSICKPVLDSREADVLYRAANGELNESDYLYATNPYSSKNPKLTKFPSKIVNFDIISTNVMTLMGEKRRRGLKYTTVAINADIESQKKELQNQLIEKFLVENLIAELADQANKAGQEFDIEAAQSLSAEQIKKKVANLSDKAAIMGQSALNYIKSFNDLEDTIVEGWYHFVTTGYVFSYRYVDRDEVIHEIVSPKEMSIYASNRDRFIKSCEVVKRKWKLSLNEIVDKFQEMKDFKAISEDLEARLGGSHASDSTATMLSGSSDIDLGKQQQFGILWDSIRNRRGENKVYSDDEGFLVEHVVWTSSCKIGKLTTQTVLGDFITEQVDDTYIPVEGDMIDWKWCDEKREAWIIEDKWILGGEPIYTAIGTFDSPHNVENPYNGLIQRMKHANPISIVKRGIPYQIKYNVVHFYIEKAMAKNMGKITIFPLGLMSNKQGFDIETTMYYANALGFMFPDETHPKFVQALQGIKVLDADLKNYIGEMYGYLDAIKSEWDNQIGMTPTRKGQMNSSDGKAVQENALFRSSIMTEEFFRQFEEFEQDDLNGLLELSKYAFVEGKKAMFIDSDNKEAFFHVDGVEFTYSDYLVKVSNSGQELQNLENAKGQAQAFAQNQMQPSKVLKLIRSNNLSSLIQEMESMEEELEKRQEAAAQADRESGERVETLRKETAQLNYDAKIYASDASKEAAIESATITAEGKLNSDLLNATGGEGEIEQLNRHIREREDRRDKKDLENKQLNLQDKKINADAETKKYVADTNLAIARENKGQ